MGKIYLGFNCNCFTNRYDEPEEWTAICKRLGIHQVMFNVDLIDPYWSWETQKKLLDRTLESCAKNDVHIFASFGGQHGHQHYLGHPDDDARMEGVEFFKRAMRQTAYLGGKSFGTCFGIQVDRTNRDPVLRANMLNKTIDCYHRLAEYGAEIGLEALAYEMTSIDRETCATFAENDYVLDRCADMVIPLRICLDMGHRNNGGLPEEADHLAWIRRYADRCDVIDCQQSAANVSCHWPFTPENNTKGIIRGEEVVQAIQDSGTQNDLLLSFELRCSAFYPQELDYMKNLEQSVEYWRQFVKD